MGLTLDGLHTSQQLEEGCWGLRAALDTWFIFARGPPFAIRSFLFRPIVCTCNETSAFVTFVKSIVYNTGHFNSHDYM